MGSRYGALWLYIEVQALSQEVFRGSFVCKLDKSLCGKHFYLKEQLKHYDFFNVYLEDIFSKTNDMNLSL